MTNRERGEKWLSDWADFANAPLDENIEVRGEFLDALAKLQDEAVNAAVATLIAERDGAVDAVDVADRQRSRAKDAKSELQRVKQERDAAHARVDKAEAECAVWRREADAAAHAGLRAQERAEKCEADAAAIREAAARIAHDDECNFVTKNEVEFAIRALPLGDAGRALLAEVSRLREENAALKERVERAEIEIAETSQQASKIAHTEVRKFAVKDSEIQRLRAAFGRAYVALKEYDTRTAAEWYAQRDAVLADHEGLAAAEYVTALETEHEAVTAHRVNGASGEILDVAHAAVEALRGK